MRGILDLKASCANARMVGEGSTVMVSSILIVEDSQLY
jgi:hypothetical protein